MKKKIGIVSGIILLFVLVFAAVYIIKANKEKEEEEKIAAEMQIKNEEKIELLEQGTIPTVVISDAKAKPGDTVSIPVRIVNNPGILGMTLTLSYDEAVLKLLSVENGAAVSEVLELTNSDNLESGCIFLWDGLEILPEQVKDGEILNLEFEILKTAPAGKTPVLLISDEGGTVDNDLKPVDFVVENGNITIREE